MTNTKRISIPFAPGSFPLAELIENGVWAQLPGAAKAVLGVIWHYYRRYPDACHPSRQTIASEAGVHPSTVSRTLDVLEKMGLVEVVPQLGPRPNNYLVKWTDIRVVVTPPAERKSPYSKRSSLWEVDLGQDEDGNDITRYTRKTARFHRMPDGCLVRSAKEVVLHSFLSAWRVPHWTDVTYNALGIKLKNPKNGERDTVSTVDFVVGPFYLFELHGVAHHQGAAKKYMDKLERKKKAISRSRWGGYVLHPEQRPGGHLLKLILKAWAEATIDDAKALREMMKRAGKFEVGHKPSRWLDELIADAQARLDGSKEPKKPRGLSETRLDEHGFQIKHATTPRLVLMESAGMQAVVDYYDDLLDADDDVEPQPTPQIQPARPTPVVKESLPEPLPVLSADEEIELALAELMDD